MKKVNLIILFMVFLSFTQGNCQTTPDKENLRTIMVKHPNAISRDIQRFISNGWVCYSDFGAKGDERRMI
jgi:hypothetical protein